VTANVADSGFDFDLAIIGGGINGAGIARDAAGQGLRVLLAEQNDLASGTSSASTKLIHGGLRYLEHGAVRLVREALIEREVLLRMAPHLVRPMRFVLPLHAGLRPAWMLRLGLFLYDHLGGRKLLPATRSLDLTRDPAGAPLNPRFTRAFEYSDCWVDDARLVVLNAVDAAARGASIRTRTRCIAAERRVDHWRLTLEADGIRTQVTARALVNAGGPWVGEVAHDVLGLPTHAPVRLVKGSHIVVPQLYTHDRAYLFQNRDGRVVFAIPYEGEFTVIGTTDVDYHGNPAAVAISSEEIAYLCGVASDYFREPVTPSQVVWTYAGVRPLYDDGASKAKDATRDYVLMTDLPADAAPLLTVYGGKITTYRKLAEHALARLRPVFPQVRRWTQDAPLPGGDFPWNGVPALAAAARTRWPFLNAAQAMRLAHAYGTHLDRVFAEGSDTPPGAGFGGGLTASEVSYLMRNEWACEPADVLWRRTKCGLHAGPAESDALARFMTDNRSRMAD
jgi:glycerol-3-phosphate dehydrogenase